MVYYMYMYEYIIYCRFSQLTRQGGKRGGFCKFNAKISFILGKGLGVVAR
jgi:hypothetical protein